MTDELKDLRKRFSNLSDDELLKIVHIDYADYREEALVIAKEELNKRNIQEIKKEELKKKSMEAEGGSKYQILAKKNRIILSIAVVTLIIAEFLKTPVNATFGYYFMGLIIKLLSYSIVLIAISALIASLQGKFKTRTLSIFSWLMLVATSFDFIIAVLKSFLY